MVISFPCPNGHKLKCPEERVGQKGKCPKCGAAFEVPSPEQAHEQEQLQQLVAVAASDEAAVGGSGSGSGVRMAGGSGSGTSEGISTSDSAPRSSDDAQVADSTLDTARRDIIVFLCPNGHKLNAPLRLQGRPGKCPDCGEKFLVPMLEEELGLDESEELLDLLETGESVHDDDEAADSGFSFVGLVPEDEFTAGLVHSHPSAMATLFARLWSQRGETGVVELYLKGGEILSPHWYAPQLSQQSFGMFAFQEQDGTHTLTAVQWDAIERIALRGMPHLPEGVFET